MGEIYTTRNNRQSTITVNRQLTFHTPPSVTFYFVIRTYAHTTLGTPTPMPQTLLVHVVDMV